MSLKWLLPPTHPLLLGYKITRLVRNGKQIQIEGVATFLVSFGAHLSILFVIKFKPLVLTKWSYRSPPEQGDYSAT